MLKNKKTNGERLGGTQMLILLTKGEEDKPIAETIAGKGGTAVQTVPNMADIICVQSKIY